MVVLTPLAYGTICEDILRPNRACNMVTPPLNCTGNYNFTVYNETNSILNGTLTHLEDQLYYFEFNQSEGDYLVVLCDNSYREIRVVGEDEMGSLAITFFILAVTGALFALPFITRFHSNDFVNIILRRSCWLIAVYLMMLNSAIMATIANFAGLDLTNEMFRYMWLFGTAGWLLMIYIAFKTVLDIFEMNKNRKISRVLDQ